ncbi:MAG: binding-protein-dependent transport system inner rane component [Enterovirga sp.]|jgi:ABC-type nitrate/sulfonate/bicarbonate transport system permease component|nr:binding-protein-dependent transport system inner rane component [Enterovirga sp.]
MRRVGAGLVRYAPVLILFVAWEALTASGLVSNVMLPNLSAVGAAFLEMVASGELLTNAARSLWRAAVGLAAAIGIGVTAGILMARYRPFRLVFNPIVQIFYPMPKSALIPVMMIWFGLGDMSKIALIFLGCLLPVVVSSFNGARGVAPALTWSALSLGATPRRVLLDVVLPAASPEILNGIRTAVAFAFILMVSSEFVIAKDGLGFLISSLGDGGVYPAMFAVILTVAVVGFAADRLYGAFARRQLRWREP